MNRFDEARDVLQQAQQRKLDDELLWINLYSIAFNKRDAEEMHRLVRQRAGQARIDRHVVRAAGGNRSLLRAFEESP